MIGVSGIGSDGGEGRGRQRIDNGSRWITLIGRRMMQLDPSSIGNQGAHH